MGFESKGNVNYLDLFLGEVSIEEELVKEYDLGKFANIKSFVTVDFYDQTQNTSIACGGMS
jgi:hypothetical protein